MSRRLMVAGNWKLHGSKQMIQTLLQGLRDGLQAGKGFDVAVFPPSVYLPLVAELLDGAGIEFGAQDVSAHEGGAHTGEVSAAMLQEFACRYCLVGHSERRTDHNESSALVAEKFKRVIEQGMTPILCVGETLEARESGRTEAVVAEQVGAVLDAHGAEVMGQGVIAYEPVWAIGTGRTASAEQAQEVHQFIRSQLAAKSDTISRRIRILYGGSCKGDNAHELFSMPDVDGGLIGGASLTSQDFLSICAQADKLS